MAARTAIDAEARYCVWCGRAFDKAWRFCGGCGAPIDVAAAGAPPYASFWFRLAAWLIDQLALWTVGGIFPFFGAHGSGPIAAGFLVFPLPLFLVYFWVGNSVGGTLGKYAVGIRVLDADGRRLGVARGLGRTVASWLSALPLFLGYFWSIWDSRRQTWHDKLVGSFVFAKG